MSIKKSEFIKRRKDLMAQMEPDSIAIWHQLKPALRNGDADYAYRQNSDFYYLTGFAEAECSIGSYTGQKEWGVFTVLPGKR